MAATTAHMPTNPAAGRPWPTLRLLYSRYGALAGYALAALAVYVGWIGREQRNIHAEHGLGYAIGILGGVLMLILLLYSLRKRVRWLARFGETRHWFRSHMILGIVGPVLILYHCNFELGDLNSKVALYCTLLVAGSGVLGRYFYAGIHHGLYGRKATLREMAGVLEKTVSGGHASALFQPIRDELAALDRRVLESSPTVTGSIVRHWTISLQTRLLYRRLMSRTRRALIAQGMTSRVVGQHADRLEATIDRYLREHLDQVRHVARFDAFERLFSLWHIVHVPFFVMMILSGLFHVFAVHLYCREPVRGASADTRTAGGNCHAALRPAATAGGRHRLGKPDHARPRDQRSRRHREGMQEVPRALRQGRPAHALP
ncbi:MAG: pyridine nucleotide-disulfide oxidoreductase [Gammaproteobacteria bacterium]|nr:pyridine nucleotide-disulfide oxidoreductase [Gammaproteobacteria bacterium]